ncbi:MerR family transcriptional regulator [Aliagarivorans taiwanensis]|uniref:MerR family transcriptional regulator n=1 Tax=Aliagarivorans taiwanensis TaxID=561966 RepID=UPI000418FD6D|nr:methyltransferase domain-containing protein [Aliagarivorans taiwanensis]
MAYRISELAAAVGLSRTALLYYEKQQLIQGKRQSNGYRVYSEHDLQRVRLIQQLQAGGLTLKECKACLEAKVDRELLRNRLQALDGEIAQKQQSRHLLAALLGEGDLKAWHQTANELAPDAHLDWLIKQGFSEKDALRLKWLSKDMNEHDQYMADFMKVFETLERWGPGSESDTLRAFEQVPGAPTSILEIGCGKGLTTALLAQHSNAQITAIDNEQSAVDALNQRAREQGLSERISAVNASMTELPFKPASFELIWAEGCAYIMGVEKALQQWRPLLKDQGVLMLSDLVWLTDSPSEQAVAFWNQEYPDIQTVATREQQVEAAGYQLLSSFTLSQQAWQNYYQPLAQRVEQLQPSMANSKALEDIGSELTIYQQCASEFGYQVFLMKR